LNELTKTAIEEYGVLDQFSKADSYIRELDFDFDEVAKLLGRDVGDKTPLVVRL
jgi:hypothetical protein